MKLAPLLLLLTTAAAVPSSAAAQSAVVAQSATAAQPARSGAWFQTQTIDFAALSPAPPAPGSKQDRQDLADVLQAQRTRTAAQVRQAQADDKEEDIFIFASVLGHGFNAAVLPLTAALSQHLREASATVNPQLKVRFARPRPFVASAQVHPVCEKTATNSYPSGHGMVGTLEALALTQIVPEHSPQVLDRLAEYLHNRVVCGVHYPSDVAASRNIASTLFGLIAASPAFESELASARAEVRSHLGLADRALLAGGSSNRGVMVLRGDDPSRRIAARAVSAAVPDYLANNTVLIVRHAEKPPEGTGDTGLTEAGRHRADAYTTYFQPFHENGQSLRITALYAGADSSGSIRPRLTLEPLSRATGLPLNTTVSTKDPADLIALLQTTPHGKTPLICWRHGQIPALLTAFGVAPETLPPNGKWPDDVFDWVIVLHLDAAGKVMHQELVHETLNTQ